MNCVSEFTNRQKKLLMSTRWWTCKMCFMKNSNSMSASKSNPGKSNWVTACLPMKKPWKNFVRIPFLERSWIIVLWTNSKTRMSINFLITCIPGQGTFIRGFNKRQLQQGVFHRITRTCRISRSVVQKAGESEKPLFLLILTGSLFQQTTVKLNCVL